MSKLEEEEEEEDEDGRRSDNRRFGWSSIGVCRQLYIAELSNVCWAQPSHHCYLLHLLHLPHPLPHCSLLRKVFLFLMNYILSSPLLHQYYSSAANFFYYFIPRTGIHGPTNSPSTSSLSYSSSPSEGTFFLFILCRHFFCLPSIHA